MVSRGIRRCNLLQVTPTGVDSEEAHFSEPAVIPAHTSNFAEVGTIPRGAVRTGAGPERECR